MNIRLAGITHDSIVDGPGLRTTYFVQGCPHHCKGCHNPETHSVLGGQLYDIEALCRAMNRPLISGITISGGEPFQQALACSYLAAVAYAYNLSVWVYTGYTYEQLSRVPLAEKLLMYTDIIVDGRFLEHKKSYSCQFRGSTNQRLIDVHATRASGHIVEWNEGRKHLDQFSVPES